MAPYLSIATNVEPMLCSKRTHDDNYFVYFLVLKVNKHFGQAMLRCLQISVCTCTKPSYPLEFSPVSLVDKIDT